MQLAQEQTQASGRRLAPLVVAALLALGLAGFLYWKAVLWWHAEWTAEGSYYAHGVFVPFFIAAMVWRDREKLKRLPIRRSWWGLVPIGLAIVLILWAYRADVTVTLSISFMLFLWGGVLLVTGGKMARALAIPMLFLFTMVPIIPNQVFDRLGIPIQMTSAKFAEAALNLTGFNAHRAGTQISMDDYTLAVEVPCSGFKTLIGLLSFSGAFAYLVEAATWKRWFLFLFALPLSIVVNGVRITLIGMVGELISSPAAAAFHDYSGFIVLILGFMALFSLARLLRCEKLLDMSLQDGPDKKDGAQDAERLTERLNRKYGLPRIETTSAVMRGMVPLVALLGIACVVRLNTHPDASVFVVMKQSDVPVSLADGLWERQGDDRPIAPEVMQTLQPDVILDRNYLASPPHQGYINLFVSGGSSRHTFHDPHDCFNGAGYALVDKGVEKIDTAAGPLMVQVSEAHSLAAPNGPRSVLMFVYVVNGKPVTSMEGVHLKTAALSILGVKTRPFYFLRFQQYANGTGPEQYEQLRSFVRAFWPAVKAHILTDQMVASAAR